MRYVIGCLLLLLSIIGANAQTGIGNNSANAATNVVAVGSAVSAGQIVILYINDEETAVTSVTATDSKGNTYTKISTFGQVAGAFWGVAFYSIITTPLTTSDTITYHLSTSAQSFVFGIAISGYNALDSGYTNTANNVGASGSFTITAAQSAAKANEFNFCFTIGNNNAAGTPSGWTPSVEGWWNANSFAGYIVNTGTSAETCSASFTGVFYGAMIFAFQPSGGSRCIIGSGVTGC